MKTGIEIITEERAGHFTREGWTLEHDDLHVDGQLRDAAETYLRELRYRDEGAENHRKVPPSPWPWEQRWWKPGNRVKQLAKAGALIAAEIDRIQSIRP